MKHTKYLIYKDNLQKASHYIAKEQNYTLGADIIFILGHPQLMFKTLIFQVNLTHMYQGPLKAMALFVLCGTGTEDPRCETLPPCMHDILKENLKVTKYPINKPKLKISSLHYS